MPGLSAATALAPAGNEETPAAAVSVGRPRARWFPFFRSSAPHFQLIKQSFLLASVRSRARPPLHRRRRRGELSHHAASCAASPSTWPGPGPSATAATAAAAAAGSLAGWDFLFFLGKKSLISYP